MMELLKLFLNIINDYHDKILDWIDVNGYPITDKQLHFIFIGVLGMIVFICVHIIFKLLSKFSITAISFIYTFSVLLVIAFAIEVQQKITGRGAMDFADAAYGIYGFLCGFGAWLAIKWTFILAKKAIDFLKKIDF